MYKVCIKDTDDQKNMTISDYEAPQTYVKFYQNGKGVEKVTTQFSWSSQEPVIKECMSRYSGETKQEESKWSMRSMNSLVNSFRSSMTITLGKQ